MGLLRSVVRCVWRTGCLALGPPLSVHCFCDNSAMMETLIGQQSVYNPHLKRVLKTYQLSAVKSLQGPSTVLGTEESVTISVLPKKKAVSESSPEPFITPPPLPIQQLPILTTPDQSRSERSETVLEGESISCFVVGGEKRLCLPQILNSVLRDFSLAQINQVCDELQIFCSRCNPEQLEVLKVTGILPSSAPSCGLITKTDAERLCSALLHRCSTSAARLVDKSVSLQLKVYHECFGKCKGVCMPELYTDSNARCIECTECHRLFSPQTFVCHAHRNLENRTCHWGFDSSNWRSYLLLVEDQPDHERRAKLLDYFKEQHSGTENNNKRKQIDERIHDGDPAKADREDDLPEVATKKPKLEDSGFCSPTTASSVYLQQSYDAFHYYNWYDTWARSVTSAFRPWPTITHLVKDAKQPLLRDSVPTYLSHDPPVLLHPERVVPLSQSEHFERSFQPNVALAPPAHRHDTKQEVKAEGREKRPMLSQPKVEPPSTPRPAFNPEIELSTDTDDSASDATPENAVGSVVEQVAAVLDALSDAKETTRQRVIGLVERLAVRLDRVEADNRRLREEKHQLQHQLDKYEQQQQQEKQQEKQQQEETEDVQKKEVATPPPVPEPPAPPPPPPPRSSPVSVITSPAHTVIKTEPQ